VEVKRILVIYRDLRSLQALDEILAPAGYDVAAATFPPVAVMDAFLTMKPALVVLDIGLPGEPLEDLRRQLRRESKEVPILVLGSTSEVADRVSLTKPFDAREFLARVRARTKRFCR
jgi:DNA-binding response OmpR family regulator